MKRIFLALLAALAILLFSSCHQKTPESPLTPKSEEGKDETVFEDQQVKSEEVIEYEIEEVVTGLEIPWDMVFTSSNRMLITERTGQLRVFEDGVLNPRPLHVFSDVSTGGEEGLMSMTLDPEYKDNQWIYLAWAYEKNGGMAVKVSRFKDAGDHLEDEFVVIDNLPAAKNHAGCRIAFGPDGKLYITVGDAFDKEEAQNLESLAGKILRLNKDGSIPEDNPFNDSPIWSYGHRNSQGIDWHPETNAMYETEHGPSVIDGPPGGDEVNHIVKGENYGWPVVSHDKIKEGMVSPLITFTPAEPPGSLLIYSGKVFPQFKNNLFFGSLRGEGIIRLELDPENPDKVITWEKMFSGEYGRIRNVMEGPDGYIYFSTSNQDGRGSPSETDDRIFRITEGEAI